MLITIVAATPFEVQPLVDWLRSDFEEKENLFFKKGDLNLQILITGIGQALTAVNLGFYFSKQIPDLAINAGIAGSFNPNFKIGEVVNVISERFGDLGTETADENFQDIHEMGLIEYNEWPFENGVIKNPSEEKYGFLPKAKGLTVNKIHGFSKSIAAIQSKYEVDLESMEGAAFFMACRMAEVNFLEIRSVSNQVEPRNRENWNLPLAIDQLNKVLKEMVESF